MVVNGVWCILMYYLEVEVVFLVYGWFDDGMDLIGFFNVEFFVLLKLFDIWFVGMIKDKLIEELLKKFFVYYFGVDFFFF